MSWFFIGHPTMPFTHTCLLFRAPPRKPSCGSVCSAKPQLRPNNTTNYITHLSWVSHAPQKWAVWRSHSASPGRPDVLHGAERHNLLTQWQLNAGRSPWSPDSDQHSSRWLTVYASPPVKPFAPSPSLSFTVISSLSASVRLLFSLSLSLSLQLHLLLPISRSPAGLTLSSLDSHTLPASIPSTAHLSSLSLPLPLSLSPPTQSLTHTHMCSPVVTSFISTLFVCSEAHAYTVPLASGSPKLKPSHPSPTTNTSLIRFKVGDPSPNHPFRGRLKSDVRKEKGEQGWLGQRGLP